MPRFRLDLTTHAAGTLYVEADDEKHARALIEARFDDDDDDFSDAGWTPDDEISIRRVVRKDRPEVTEALADEIHQATVDGTLEGGA